VLPPVLWLALSAILLIVLPAACAFIPEDRDNGYVHHSGEDEPGSDDEGGMLIAA
jgi:hypothetical protein